METLERIAARVGRVACSPDNSPEALLESAGLVSELATEFEEFQRRAAEPVGADAASAAGSSEPEPVTSEAIARKPCGILQTE